MGTLSIYPSYPQFKDANGALLNDGKIYVGTAGLDPVENQISLYWDDLLAAPASQPVSTINGYPSNSGTRGMLYMSGTDYSMTVLDKNNVEIYSSLNLTDINYAASSTVAGDVAQNTLDIAQNASDIADNATDIGTNTTKLSGIEDGADVTDATNVNASGATMNTDTDLSSNSYFLDEDDMSSDDATKVPSQQSVKAYVDSATASSSYGVYIDQNETSQSDPLVSDLIGTRIDETDGAYAASTFEFRGSLAVSDSVGSGTGGQAYLVNFSVKKNASGNPFANINVVYVSASTTANYTAYGEQGSLGTAGAPTAVTATPTTSGATARTVVIERVTNSDELCFRITFNGLTGSRDYELHANLSGPRAYTGTLISSSNGTEF